MVTRRTLDSHSTVNRQHSTDTWWHSTVTRRHSTDTGQHSTVTRRHSTVTRRHSTVTRRTLDDTRRLLDDTRRSLDGHSTLGTRHSTDTRHSALDTRRSLDTRHSALGGIGGVGVVIIYVGRIKDFSTQSLKIVTLNFSMGFNIIARHMDCVIQKLARHLARHSSRLLTWERELHTSLNQYTGSVIVLFTRSIHWQYPSTVL